ncbi:MAG: hypothetical protein ACFFDW_11815 [Candidatus Thorarchaeota archaeon]
MTKWSKISLAIGLMIIVSIPLVPAYVMGWKQETSWNQERPNFTTHQWLAFEALQLSPSTSMLQWIENNRLAFWLGVEAPFYSVAASAYDVDYETNYGDIDSLVLYLDVTGTTVTNGNLSDRAQEEYEKLVAELGKVDGDHELAAFYAGTMAHYISQAGLYAALWDETLWGTLNVTSWVSFENFIEETLVGNHFENDPSDFRSNVFTLSPSVITPVNASQAAINLAKAIHPLAEGLGDNFDIHSTSVGDWDAAYIDDVTDCLTYSAEAIYAAIKHALEAVNWKYLSITDPNFTFNQTTGHMVIPEFSVNYTDNSGTYAFTEDNATVAEFRVLATIDDETVVQPEKEPLSFNESSNKWYHEDHLLKGAVANAEHTILYTFKMNLSALTWSNYSTLTFDVTYYFVNITNISAFYNPITRSLDIYDVNCELPDLPEIGVIDDTEVDEATWILYTKGEGTQVSEAIGIEAYDTEGRQPHGPLTFDNISQTWYSYDNDIGLVFTATLQQYYVVVRFEISGLPVGFTRTTQYGTTFYPYAQKGDDYWFITRDHIITITKPRIVLDLENNFVNVYDITAFSDYNVTELDYYEIHGKTVYGQDRRSARWKIFLYDGIPSSITGDLIWDDESNYWYAEDIPVDSLPDNTFYISAKITNMNVNATISPWGPASDTFVIKRPIPIVYFILPEIFLAGFVVLFGWLVWWRPRQKKLRIERDRAAKISKGFGD